MTRGGTADTSRVLDRPARRPLHGQCDASGFGRSGGIPTTASHLALLLNLTQANDVGGIASQAMEMGQTMPEVGGS
jgi:hypothetical protein